jgi:hypothetical protein
MAAAQTPLDPQAEDRLAFRQGLLGRPLGERLPAGLAEGGAVWAAGPNEATIAGTPRLPGLVGLRASWETGRALRAIGLLLDRAGAPERIGAQFRDDVGAAVAAHRLRRLGRAWGAADTVEMFVEVWERVLGRDDPAAPELRRRLLDFAAGDDAALERRTPFEPIRTG